jgi:hypothetical protein
VQTPVATKTATVTAEADFIRGLCLLTCDWGMYFIIVSRTVTHTSVSMYYSADTDSLLLYSNMYRPLVGHLQVRLTFPCPRILPRFIAARFVCDTVTQFCVVFVDICLLYQSVCPLLGLCLSYLDSSLLFCVFLVSFWPYALGHSQLRCRVRPVFFFTKHRITVSLFLCVWPHVSF